MWLRPLNELANTFNTCNPEQQGLKEFKNVTFEYEKSESVIKNISFKVKPGTNIALVGPTGAGKTTIVNLLTGFYQIEEGEIFIDKINIKDYKKDSLRRIFGMVLQDTYLFYGTIKEKGHYYNLYKSQFANIYI